MTCVIVLPETCPWQSRQLHLPARRPVLIFICCTILGFIALITTDFFSYSPYRKQTWQRAFDSTPGASSEPVQDWQSNICTPGGGAGVGLGSGGSGVFESSTGTQAPSTN